MNTCKHCRWWRVAIGETGPEDYGWCMFDPPAVFCDYEPDSGETALMYERPQTYERDFCSKFENGKIQEH